jgi:hypothetical protein
MRVLYRETGVIFNVSKGHFMSNRWLVLVALLFAELASAAETLLAFPGAVGVNRTGCHARAVKKAGPRLVVIEAGGVIDLG